MGLIAWWRRRRGKVSLVLEISPELMALYEHEARRADVSVEVWARRSLNRSIPLPELKRLEEAARREVGLDDMLPEYSGPKANGVTNGKHPCRHIRLSVMPPNYAAGECQGTCASPDRNFVGRPCHWSPLRAHDCPGFRSSSDHRIVES